MNVPRYWRKNTQRYRLVGVQYQDGQKSIVNRPQLSQTSETETETEKEHSIVDLPAA